MQIRVERRGADKSGSERSEENLRGAEWRIKEEQRGAELRVKQRVGSDRSGVERIGDKRSRKEPIG